MSNRQVKLSLLFIFLIFFHTTSIAQKGNFTLTPTIEVNTSILDNGLGFHIGLNPTYVLADFFALEAQVSFARVEIDGTFISGKQDTQSNFNTLAGGRLYIVSEKKSKTLC